MVSPKKSASSALALLTCLGAVALVRPAAAAPPLDPGTAADAAAAAATPSPAAPPAPAAASVALPDRPASPAPAFSAAPTPPPTPPSGSAPPAAAASGSTFTVGGYVEAYYSYNFNNPSNGLTNLRAFDNRHNAITLQNLVADLGWEYDAVYAAGAIQFGQVGETYYGVSEPSLRGSSGASPGGAEVFKHIQKAYLGWGPTKALRLEAGLFISPLGPESMPTHENWTWSHSNLFFGLPFYHSGIRAGYDLSKQHNVRLGVYNGWNNALDNNAEKSVALEYTFTPSDDVTFAAQYFGGVERPTGALEGRAWRHLLDASVKVKATPYLELLADVDGGVEPNRLGTSAWLAGILAARVRAAKWLYFAGRQTMFAEKRAKQGLDVADPIAIPVEWMTSTTATVDVRPVPHLSAKLEYRHDAAEAAIFYRSVVTGDGGDASPFVANARSQDTLTLGLTAWF